MLKNPFRNLFTTPYEPVDGECFIVTSTGAMVSMDRMNDFRLTKGDGANDSEATQAVIDEQNAWGNPFELIEKPYPPSSYLTLLEHNTPFSSCVSQIATDVAGLGWTLDHRQPGSKLSATEEKTARTFLEHPNEDESIHEIGSKLITDLGAIGMYCLEIARNNGGKVGKVFHVPAENIWIHQDLKKYAMRKGSGILWYKKFGEKEDIDESTGKTAEVKEKANEMIIRINYFPGKGAYGAPRVLPAVGAIVGMMGVASYNISFFKNYGIPAYFVKLTGKWKPGTNTTIEQFMNTTVKGSNNAHKTFVMQLPTDGEIEIERISIDKRDGSFRMFNKEWRTEILMSHRMPPYRVALAEVGSLGGNVATEMTQIYKQSVVEPAQTTLESIWNNQIFNKGLCLPNILMSYIDMDARDMDAEIELWCLMEEHGFVNPNEGREKFDLGEPYEDGAEFRPRIVEPPREIGKLLSKLEARRVVVNDNRRHLEREIS